MESARLILDYLKVLIWPAATLAMVFGFRRPLEELIQRIRSLSAPGVDAQFSDRVIGTSLDVVAAVRHNPPEPGPVPRPGPVPGAEPEPVPEPRPDPEPVLPPVPGPESPREMYRRRLRPGLSPLPRLGSLSGASLRDAYNRQGWSDLQLEAPFSPGRAILSAYVEVELAVRVLAEAKGISLPKRQGIGPDLLRRLGLPEAITIAFNELRDVRNRVAHLRATPSTTAALSYVDSCQELVEWLEREQFSR